MSWNNLSDINKGYIAGIFDGEGSIFIGRSKRKDNKTMKYWLGIQVGMTSLIGVKLFLKTFGGTISIKSFKTKNLLMQYCWSASAQTAITILRLLLPYLKIKIPQAKLAIEYMNKRTNSINKKLSNAEIMLREYYHKRMRLLNKNGI